MKAVIYDDVGKLHVGEVEDARVQEPTDAVVRITSAAICGSDLHAYHGKSPLFAGETIGHEGMGIVSEVGPDVTRFKPGDRVVIAFNTVCGECWFCRNGQTALCGDFRYLGGGAVLGGLGGTQAEAVRIPVADFNLLPVPDRLADEQALFLGDILTTAVYGAGIAGIRPGDTVAVVGAGPVGFLAAQAARLHDPGQVLVLDLQPDRLSLAEKVGALSINVAERNPSAAVDELTEGRGADVVLECVGHPTAYESAVDIVRRGGTVCVIGVYTHETVDVQLGFMWSRALRLIFAGVCPVPAWWDRALQAVQDGTVDPRPIISHTLPLDDAPHGYELFASKQATKVVLLP